MNDSSRGAPDTSGTKQAAGVEIAADQLSNDALRGLVEEFVSREGTDYGHRDWSFEEKIAQVFRQISNGEARIVFDPELESASIVPAD